MRVKFDELLKGINYLQSAYGQIHSVDVRMDKEKKTLHIEYKAHEIVFSTSAGESPIAAVVKVKAGLK